MTTNRADARVRRGDAGRNPTDDGGAPQRAQREYEQALDRRRAEMHAAEGHAGSIPRGNQREEDDNVGHRRREWDRLLGH